MRNRPKAKSTCVVTVRSFLLGQIAQLKQALAIDPAKLYPVGCAVCGCNRWVTHEIRTVGDVCWRCVALEGNTLAQDGTLRRKDRAPERVIEILRQTSIGGFQGGAATGTCIRAEHAARRDVHAFIDFVRLARRSLRH